MILAQNRLRLLSGNNILFGLVFFCFLLTSCKTKKPMTNTRPVNNSPKYAKSTIKSKVDTIQWTEKKVNSVQSSGSVISPMSDMPMEKKSEYKVVLFIPFKSGNYNPDKLLIGGTSENRFSNYYAGVKLALDDLKFEGVNIDVEVFDSESGDFQKKLNTAVDADIIIGPYDRNQLKKAAEFCKKNQIVNISPWQSSSKITSNNPYYVQLRPSLTKYYDAIVEDAVQQYRKDQVFLLGRDNKKDLARMNHMQKTAAALTNDQSGQKYFQEFIINPDSLVSEATTYDEIFSPDETTVFILPNWSGEDEDFIYNALRKISAEKLARTVIVYAMPIALDSENINFDFYSNLNIKVARAKWVDKNDNKIQQFRTRFFNTYNALPVNDAYDGYDMAKFVLGNLWRNGKTFQHILHMDNSQYLQASFDVIKVFNEEDASLDNFNNINYYQNFNVDIIEFRNGKLQRLR